MTYYVNLGGILLYGIKNVEDNSEREITSYDGIGQGFFPVPESRKLRTWTFECEMTEQNRSRLANWTAASKVFTGFEVLLATKDPSRFIFVSNNRNESISGYLTGYSKKEEYPGVYNVTVKVTEYKAAGVKTTDIPYVKRPGKAPAMSKTVVYNAKTTPYTDMRNGSKGESQNSTKSQDTPPQNYYVTKDGVMVYDPKTDKYVLSKTKVTSLAPRIKETDTGKTVVNLSAINDGTQYQRDLANWDKFKNNDPVGKAFDSIGKTFIRWREEEIKRRDLWNANNKPKFL